MEVAQPAINNPDSKQRLTARSVPEVCSYSNFSAVAGSALQAKTCQIENSCKQQGENLSQALNDRVIAEGLVLKVVFSNTAKKAVLPDSRSCSLLKQTNKAGQVKKSNLSLHLRTLFSSFDLWPAAWLCLPYGYAVNTPMWSGSLRAVFLKWAEGSGTALGF